jgi:Mlc titration factor MtfA (ptsG expression regulator)
MYILLIQEEKNTSLFIQVAIILLTIFIIAVIIWQFWRFIETFWVENISPKPFYNHVYFRKRKLSDSERFILKNQFSFYQKLSPKKQQYFEHRVHQYISKHKFEGRKGVYIDEQKKILISATAVMLTFGYRDYMLNTLDKFLIYPEVFYSNINKALHKGEFNPGYKAIIYSWEDFMDGYDISNDNFNLAIHELVHAMHFDYLRDSNESISSSIFINQYHKLLQFLKNDELYKNNLVQSKYLRNYAFTNNFEFIAVLIEAFFETPLELRTQFPEIYHFVRKMLNYK